MEEKKYSVQLFDELQSLLAVRKKLTVKTEINNLIADTAEKFIATLNAEIADETKKVSAPPASTKKSEMPCNCRQEKSLQSVIASVAKRIEENSDSGKGLAAIMIVPLADLLAAGD